MRVEHALGVAGRAARVAERRGLALLHLGIVILARARLGEQVLVAQRVRQLAAVAVAHHHVVGDAVERGGKLLQHRHERVVDEDDLVLRVVDDVRELLGEEADVQGVQHRAHAGDGEVQLEVLLVVPGEGGHAIALLHAKTVKHACQPIDAVRQAGVADPPDLAALLQRDDLGTEVARAHPAAYVVEGQLEIVLHQTFQELCHPLPAPSLGAS